MILERSSHETLIAVPDCMYIAAIEAVYGSEGDDVEASSRYIRFGAVGYSEPMNLYPDQIEGLRHLLDEVEKYLSAQK